MIDQNLGELLEGLALLENAADPRTRILDIPADMLNHFWGDNLVIKLHLEGESGEKRAAFSSTKVEHEAA